MAQHHEEALAVLIGATGVEPCYVSYQKAIANWGALNTVPTVTASPNAKFTVANVAMNTIAKEWDGIFHAIGELLEFTIEATGAQNADCYVEITDDLGTPTRKRRPERFPIIQRIEDKV